MPIFTQPISQQNTGYSAGVHPYPSISQLAQYTVNSDSFKRETLNPTNGYQYYTTLAASSGTVTIAGTADYASAVTTNISNDYVGFRMSGMSFGRQDPTLSPRSILSTDIVFINTATNVQLFCGLVQTTSGLTALPTTVRHMGIYGDTSVDANYHFTSANGTTQVKPSTGSALNGATWSRLNILWNGLDSATLTFYTEGSNITQWTQVAQTTVSSIANGGADVEMAMELHFWVKTLTTSAATLNVMEWVTRAT